MRLVVAGMVCPARRQVNRIRATAVSIGQLQVRLVNAALQLLDHAIEFGEVQFVETAEADAAFAGADLAGARDEFPDDVALRDVETIELAARGEAGLF